MKIQYAYYKKMQLLGMCWSKGQVYFLRRSQVIRAKQVASRAKLKPRVLFKWLRATYVLARGKGEL